MSTSGRSLEPRLHVLFVNTQDVLRADVSVHVSLAQALDRSRVRVSVATNLFEAAGDSARAAFESIPDITILPLNLGRPVSTQRGLRKTLALLDNLRGGLTLLGLAAWCRRQHVDIVHVTERPRDMLFGFLLARLGGSACLIHGHTTYYPHPPSRSAALADWLLSRADAVVGVSEFTARSFWETGPVARERVHAVHNATDAAILSAHTDAHTRAQMRQQLGMPVDVPVIGSIGRLMRGKDQATLLEAFPSVLAQYPTARLVLAGAPADIAPDGQGDYRDYLVRRTHALGLDEAVVFTGFLPHVEMPRLYAAMDLFAHPCVEEPFGLVVVEAMARGVPVVAVNAGGVPEIIRNGIDGVLVPPRAPAELATAITRVLDDPDVAAALTSAAGPRVREAFTPEAQAHAMLEVYRDVLRLRSRRSTRRGRSSYTASPSQARTRQS